MSATPTAPTPHLRVLGCSTDESLAELARDGDERAFEVIVERYRSQLLAHARRIVGDGAAEDALQHALVCAWRALRRRHDVRHVRAWLFKIVRRSALQTLREQRELPHELTDAAGPQALSVEDEFERSARARAVLAALAALPLREREALVGTSVEGRSANAVARELGIADGALRQLVFRARTRARATVGALTPPVLTLRLRALAGGWHRRAHTLCSHASGSLAPISSPIAVGSAIVIAAAGAQVAGVPLLPGGGHARHVSPARLATRTAVSPSLATTTRASRAHRGVARALVQARGTTSESPAARVGSEPAGGSATAGVPRSPANGGGTFASAGRGQTEPNAQASAPAGLVSPSTPSLPAPQTPAVGGSGAVQESATGALGAVAGAAGEATHDAGQTVEHVVTTVVEPLAPRIEAPSNP